jgi:hypothetical protein
VHDLNILDVSFSETGMFYVMDRGSIDFERLFVFTLCLAFFAVRTKEKRLAAAALLSRGQDDGRVIGSHRHSDCHRFRESLSVPYVASVISISPQSSDSNSRPTALCFHR